MITLKRDRKTPVLPTSNLPGEENPFYMLCDGVPLPLAVKRGMPEALTWRDEWERTADNCQKSSCCYHPQLRNWVGGAEDGVGVAKEAQTAWGV